jgi:hypothetical protein
MRSQVKTQTGRRVKASASFAESGELVEVVSQLLSDPSQELLEQVNTSFEA